MSPPILAPFLIGERAIVPDHLSGIYRGGHVPPDPFSYSKSVGGDTPGDGRSWRPITRVGVFTPKTRQLLCKPSGTRHRCGLRRLPRTGRVMTNGAPSNCTVPRRQKTGGLALG